MDIKTAIERVATLREKADRLSLAISAALKSNGYGHFPDVSVSVFVVGCGTISVHPARDDALNMLRETKVHYEDEISRLQPVIDMANAALKGIGA